MSTEWEHDLADQPPEVTTTEPGQRGSLPPAAAAATRLREFVAWFGDGIVVGPSDDWAGPGAPTLYARDLEAVARAILRGAA